MNDAEIIENIEMSLNEKVVTSIDSSGQRTKKKDAKTRKRQANANSSMSKSERKKAARKAVKTKKKI